MAIGGFIDIGDLVAVLGRALLGDNAEHVAACRRVDGKGC